MSLPEPGGATLKFVSRIHDGVINTSDAAANTLHYLDEAELICVVKQLVEDGYAFVDAPSGWPPAAVLLHLREQGLLDTPFIAVTWSGPGHPRTYPL
ncbi:MAG: hypothetical protein LAT63_08225 [Marinobacter sp.]|nr:hypothetical protein [Marinobacter sp.]